MDNNDDFPFLIFFSILTVLLLKHFMQCLAQSEHTMNASCYS